MESDGRLSRIAKGGNVLRNCCVAMVVILWSVLGASSAHAQMPGTRTVLDAHNCYPYDGRWSDRIDRALSAGFPVAIEQDVNWYVPPNGGSPRVLVAHGGALTGKEPTLESYFFQRVRPMMEAALRNPDPSQWPLITLNLDFKSEEPELVQAVWAVLEKHRAWLTTAVKGTNDQVQPLKLGPMLVLTGAFDAQQKVFYDDVPVGGRLLTFGAVHVNMENKTAAPAVIEAARATNYRRWWNNPWDVIEPEGQEKAGAWTAASQNRLKAFVNHSHQQGLWIRFYTLDGASQAEQSRNGWFADYNFKSEAAAKLRWDAEVADGVDYLATDEYEKVGALIKSSSKDSDAIARK